MKIKKSQVLNKTFSTMHITWNWPAPQFKNIIIFQHIDNFKLSL